MIVLAFESSSRSASVAIVREDTLLAQSFQNNGLTHSQTLMPMAEDLLKNAGLALRDIDLVAVTHGPGSFTGLRIGLAAAQGLAWGAGLPCLGVSSLEAAAMGIAHCDGLICAVMDARRDQVYNALFMASGGALARLTEDRALPLAELWGEMKKKNPILVGDGAQLCYNKRNEEPARLAPAHLRHPNAWAVAALAARLPEDARATTPRAVYLRPSQAERNRLNTLESEVHL